jgi:hypothetical protein
MHVRELVRRMAEFRGAESTGVSTDPATMPGQAVSVGTSGFEFMVLGEDGNLQRVKLVLFLHEATLSIVSTGITRAGSEDFDLPGLLARWVMPRPLRPAPVGDC